MRRKVPNKFKPKGRKGSTGKYKKTNNEKAATLRTFGDHRSFSPHWLNFFLLLLLLLLTTTTRPLVAFYLFYFTVASVQSPMTVNQPASSSNVRKFKISGRWQGPGFESHQCWNVFFEKKCQFISIKCPFWLILNIFNDWRIFFSWIYR